MEFLWLRVDGKNVGVRAECNESRDILSDVAADGEGWSREFQLGQFGGRTGPSCVFITEAGEAYLKLWTESLDQYQKMMNTFFSLYTGQPSEQKNEHGQ